jgi:hypothetical protein
MQKNAKRVCGAAVLSMAAVTGRAVAQMPTLDGVLTPGEGYSLVATQMNVTTSLNADGGGPSGISNEATASSTGNFTQLSNAYGFVSGTGSAATLNLFVGGSVSQNTDTKIDIALQTNSNGVSSLNGVNLNGTNTSSNLDNITFDTGFKPNAFIVMNLNEDMSGGTTTGTYSLTNNFFTDLSGSGAADPTVTGTLDNALVNTPIGTGAAGDPGFAGASTGLEFSISLASLGYTDGSDVEALLFPSVGSDNRTDNQILAPFTYNPADSSGGYDYTYFDNNESGAPGRQFTGVDYIGNQFFTVPGVSAVPEPASLGLISLAGITLLGRRSRKVQD